jgi:hypothetical protein
VARPTGRPTRPTRRSTGWLPGCRVVRPMGWPAAQSNMCSSPWGQPINPRPEHKHQTQDCGQPFRSNPPGQANCGDRPIALPLCASSVVGVAWPEHRAGWLRPERGDSCPQWVHRHPEATVSQASATGTQAIPMPGKCRGPGSGRAGLPCQVTALGPSPGPPSQVRAWGPNIPDLPCRATVWARTPDPSRRANNMAPGPYRRWHPGQNVVPRPPRTTLRNAVAQRGQGRPAWP